MLSHCLCFISHLPSHDESVRHQRRHRTAPLFILHIHQQPLHALHHAVSGVTVRTFAMRDLDQSGFLLKSVALTLSRFQVGIQRGRDFSHSLNVVCCLSSGMHTSGACFKAHLNSHNREKSQLNSVLPKHRKCCSWTPTPSCSRSLICCGTLQSTRTRELYCGKTFGTRLLRLRCV